MFRFALLFVAIAVLPAVLPAAPNARSTVFARNGMVATAHPLATQIGLDVLRAGGSAVDAAVAANAALGLMEPTSCGVGGDLYALVWDAKAKKLTALNASGRAPLAATREYFAAKGLTEIPERGPLSWSVPGCVDGWAELLKRHGRKSLGELLAPAIRYAEDGVPVPERIAAAWMLSAKRLREDAGSAAVFLTEGRTPRAGEVFRNPALARTYRLLAEKGRDGFYRGPVAADLVALSEKAGGLFTRRDFDEHTSTWVEPVSTNYRGYDGWQIPPPGQGIATLQMLNLLEGYDLKKLGPDSADYWHFFLEAKKLAFADRAKYYADPAFVQVPVADLIAKPYADARRKLIDPKVARIGVEPGDPKLSHAETTYLCAVDADRNCCSLIQSNYMGFGSGLASAEFGFGIQNRGCLFALHAEHANALQPGKRPFHTIIPGFVSAQGEPRFVFGVMGGDMQPQGQVEVLVNRIDFGMTVQAAGDAPRLEHTGHATPTGKLAAEHGGTVLAETGISDAVLDELRRRGHVVKRVAVNGGGYQGIWIDLATGVLHGATESRKDGCAQGY